MPIEYKYGKNNIDEVYWVPEVKREGEWVKLWDERVSDARMCHLVELHLARYREGFNQTPWLMEGALMHNGEPARYTRYEKMVGSA